MTAEEIIIQREDLDEYVSSHIPGNEYIELADFVVNECVFFIPDDNIPGFITFGTKPGSFKLGNICLNLRKTVIKTMEWSLAAAIPDSKLNALRFVIATALWVVQATKEEISDLEAILIEWMNDENLYDHYINEQDLIEKFSKYYKDYHQRDIVKQEIMDATNHLYQVKCIDIVNGNIRLCEKVWGRR